MWLILVNLLLASLICRLTFCGGLSWLIYHCLSYLQIGLEQGLEMLQIFKTFAEESSLLEDFEFYEKREQSHETKRNTAPQPEIHGNFDSPVNVFLSSSLTSRFEVIQVFWFTELFVYLWYIIMMIYYIWSLKTFLYDL